MIKIIAQTNEIRTLRKIQSLLFLETEFLKKQIRSTQDKIENYKHRYGKSDMDSLYGQVDDMEILEWEGEIETLKRLKKKLTSYPHHKHTEDGRIIDSERVSLSEVIEEIEKYIADNWESK